ncbi:MAG: hypothetical protein GY754_19785, partial [bacterium]|nr:hypothetical protein [bacterium]
MILLYQKISSCCAVVLCLVVISCSPGYSGKQQPLVKKGVLDLRQWDLEKDGPVKLRGEWEFYWKEFRDPGASSENSAESHEKNYIEVPGVWNGHKAGGEKLPGEGFASYRMVIYFNKYSKPLAFKFLDTSTAFKCYLNGKELAKAGITGKSAEEMKPAFVPKRAV